MAKKRPEWDVIPVGGNSEHSKIQRELKIARAVSITLLKLFQDGSYHNPQELQQLLSDVAEKFGIEEINLSSVVVYLAGVLEEDDYDSVLHQALGGMTSVMDGGEQTKRLALTTVEALIKDGNVGTIKPTGRGGRGS